MKYDVETKFGFEHEKTKKTYNSYYQIIKPQ
jgi:hypothetical protein